MGIFDRIKKGNKAKQEQLEKVQGGPVEVKEEKEEKKEEVKKEEKKPAAKKTEKKASKKMVGSAYKILIRPYVSEKAALGEVQGEYTFEVARGASKEQIKAAIESTYGVKPKKVRTMQMDGKEVRFGWRFGRRNDYKKAIVKLPKGKTISIHEGV